ncbi:MAG: hypothetical protein C4617_05085 [Candidatus Liberibacter europaeus]|uniref:Uncharacterized protein n=1 Tax=Candidatus Liberibacter europaeus TaxID=744859 RepID=A0A2T4VWJ3_9HYPH|nr:hypothetical protein [Candidatus Liberibacter europaeus]PTL86142.1 MAG: hypothetical protein C4617_05085 [Candidatus Liberibacter europaeus]
MNNVIPFKSRTELNLEQLSDKELAEVYEYSLECKKWANEVEEVVQARILKERKDIIPNMKLVVIRKSPRKWNAKYIDEIHEIVGDKFYQQKRLMVSEAERLVTKGELSQEQLSKLREYMISSGSDAYGLVPIEAEKPSVFENQNIDTLIYQKNHKISSQNTKKVLDNNTTTEDYLF